ncbi:MAG: KAP family NTPase, partial [Opitutales bacterium]|nr:KAP family NTPase [Opitutales bacterium]
SEDLVTTQMDTEKSQLPSVEEIATLSWNAQLALLGRGCMRVFPLIGADGHFDFWGNRAKETIEVIFASILSTLQTRKLISPNDVVDKLRYAENQAIENGFPNAANVVRSVSQSLIPQSDSLYIALAAVTATSYDSEAGDVFSRACWEDFEELKDINIKRSVPWAFFENRLFREANTDSRSWVIGNDIGAFERVEAIDYLDWWFDFFEGTPPPRTKLMNWLEDWENSISKRAKKIDKKILKGDDGEVLGFHASYESLEEPEKEVQSGEDKQRPVYQATNAADGAARVDFLNRSELIDSLAGMLAQENQQTPLTIGLFGHWGAGKSSVMQMLQEKLTDPEYLKSQEFLFSWFNCWEYEHTENIQAGLAQEVVEGLMGDGKFHDAERKFIRPMGMWLRICTRVEFLWIEKKWETIFWFGKTVATLAAIIAGGFFALESSDTPIFQTGITGVALLYFYNLSKQGKLLWDHPLKTELATFFKLPSYRKELGQIPQIRQQLESLCEVRLWDRGKARRRLVVFVDDMDRCKPETIAQAFDAIRLIVDIRQVIVIVGIDERVAFKAMGEAYKDYADPSSNRTKEDVARDYLGKIIQVPIRLNPPSAKDLKPYVEDKLFKDQAEVPTEDLGTDKPENSNEDHETPIQAEAQGPEASKKQEGNDIGEASNIESTSESSKNVGPRRRANLEENSEKVEMKETTEEVVAFYDLVRLFEFGNPRQLLRLRNSYRMLKGIDPETNQKLIDDRSLMIMLFWSEFRLEKPSDKVKQWIENSEIWLSEVVESIQKDESRESEAVMKFQKEFHPLIHEKQEGTSESEFYFENTALFELEAFTKTCILPYPKKEQVKRSNGT